jgi:hypothetical protein
VAAGNGNELMNNSFVPGGFRPFLLPDLLSDSLSSQKKTEKDNYTNQ